MAPVQVSLNLAGLPPHHAAVLAALADFDADLRGAGALRAAFQQRPRDAPGTKGQFTDLVMTLTGPAVAAAAVHVLHRWLSRDKRRTVTLTMIVTDDLGERRTVTTIEGDGVSVQAVRRAIERLGQAPR
jgi:hypothetical protein